MIPCETSSLLSAMPGIVHGFLGRQGGTSSGPFDSNNMSTSVGDNAETVASNRGVVAHSLGFTPENFCLLKQVHSNRVETLSHAIEPGIIEADAMVTRMPGLLLGVLTADCTPILFADREAGIIGAAHAGWRGAVDGVAQATIEAMIELGAIRENIVAAYGPTIYGENYEVGDQFKADFLAIHPTGGHHFHTPTAGKPHFNLPGFIEEKLYEAGIAKIDQVGGCTYACPGKYFSHRRATHEGTKTGRQVAVIGLTQV